MITLYLARHGETEQNLAHIYQGQMPGKLTQLGEQQAAELGERLADVHFDSLVSSDLARAMRTVEIAFGDRKIPHITTPLLREIDWGSWTGLTIRDVNFDCRAKDAETDEMLYERAGNFLAFLKEHFEGQTILAVGHGMINRNIVAQIQHLPYEQVHEIPIFKNCEHRIFHLS